jgi:hypothetical protein
MTTRNRKIVWLSLIPAAVLAVGIVASFVRMQVHAADNLTHTTAAELSEKYVPRKELDHRLDAQMRLMEDIHTDVQEMRQDIRDLD